MDTINIDSINSATSASSLNDKYIDGMSLDLASLSRLPSGFYKVIYDYDLVSPHFIVFDALRDKIYQVGDEIFVTDKAYTTVYNTHLRTHYKDDFDNNYDNDTFYTVIYIQSAHGLVNTYLGYTQDFIHQWGDNITDFVKDSLDKISELSSKIGDSTKTKLKTGILLGGGFIIVLAVIKSSSKD